VNQQVLFQSWLLSALEHSRAHAIVSECVCLYLREKECVCVCDRESVCCAYFVHVPFTPTACSAAAFASRQTIQLGRTFSALS